MKKVLTMSLFVELVNQVFNEKIILSRMVEIINNVAFFKYKIEGTYQTLDDKEISCQDMDDYVMALNRWKAKVYSDNMTEAMSKPNAPNYLYSNNS